jgi:anti-sigma factor RsiW
MSTREQHQSEFLGAYALGVLDDAEARVLEDHVAVCAPCRTELDELAAMRDALGEVPPEAFLDGPPEDGDLLLHRTLRQVRAEKSAGRGARRLVVAAASVVAVAIALGGGVLIGRGADSTPTVVALPPPTTAPPTTVVPGTKVISGTDGGMRLTATVTPAAGWVRVNASVVGLPVGQKCQLVITSTTGQTEVAGSWLVSAKGSKSGTNLDGAALIDPDQVKSVEVRNFAGQTFVAASA